MATPRPSIVCKAGCSRHTMAKNKLVLACIAGYPCLGGPILHMGGERKWEGGEGGGEA